MTRHSVVAGVVVDSERRVLMSERRKGVPYPEHWEFPGGKMYSNETPTQALVRELHEETGIRAADHAWLCRFEDEDIVLDVYVVLRWTGVAIGREGQKIWWRSLPDEEEGFKMTPATVHACNVLRERTCI